MGSLCELQPSDVSYCVTGIQTSNCKDLFVQIVLDAGYIPCSCSEAHPTLVGINCFIKKFSVNFSCSQDTSRYLFCKHYRIQLIPLHPVQELAGSSSISHLYNRSRFQLRVPRPHSSLPSTSSFSPQVSGDDSSRDAPSTTKQRQTEKKKKLSGKRKRSLAEGGDSPLGRKKSRQDKEKKKKKSSQQKDLPHQQEVTAEVHVPDVSWSR